MELSGCRLVVVAVQLTLEHLVDHCFHVGVVGLYIRVVQAGLWERGGDGARGQWLLL